MISCEVGPPFFRDTDDPSLPSMSVTKVTVTIEVLTQSAIDCATHLFKAANEFGTRPIEADNGIRYTSGGKGWL